MLLQPSDLFIHLLTGINCMFKKAKKNQQGLRLVKGHTGHGARGSIVSASLLLMWWTREIETYVNSVVLEMERRWS